jgi:hypothetical protein
MLALRKLLADPTRRATSFQRFWALVKCDGEEACWPYGGYIATHGYGQFSVVVDGQQVRVRAHRFAWLAARGEIPAGQEVCHGCDNPACVNPSHLFLGSHRENHLDAVRKGRKNVFGRQKLDADDVRAIRALHATGRLTQRAIGQQFGIARHTVSGIVHRKSWAHLQQEAM